MRIPQRFITEKKLRLYAVYDYASEMADISDRITEAMARSTRTTASYKFDGAGHNKGYFFDKMAEHVCDIEKLKRWKDKATAKYFAEYERVDNLISELGKIGKYKHEAVLRERYILFMEWSEIAAFRGVTQRRVLQIHQEALKELEALRKADARK